MGSQCGLEKKTQVLAIRLEYVSFVDIKRREKKGVKKRHAVTQAQTIVSNTREESGGERVRLA